MATKAGEAFYEVSARDEQLRSKLREIDGLLRTTGTAAERNLSGGFSRAMTSAGQAMTSIGRQATQTGRAMTTGLTLPIVGAGAAIFKVGSNFESEMQKIVGLVGESQAQVDEWSQQLLRLGPELGKSPQELAEALYFVASAGFEGAEALDVLEHSARASASGLGETKDIAGAVTSAMRGYAASGLSAGEATDILVAAVREGKADAAEFAQVLGPLVPLAASLGIEFGDFMGVLAVMTRTTGSATLAKTNLMGVMTALLKPGTQAQKMLEKVGLSAEGLRRQLREEGLLATMYSLRDAFEGNEEALAQVFPNVRGLIGVLNVLGQDADSTAAAIDGVRFASGSLDDAWDAASDTARTQMNRAMAEMSVLLIELAQDVLPAMVSLLRSLGEGIRSVAAWWRSLDQGTRDFIIRAAGITAVLGPALLIFGKFATALGSLFQVVGFLTGAKGIPLLVSKIPMIGGAMVGLLGPIGIVAGALAAFHVAWETDFLGMRSVLEGIGDAIADIANNIPGVNILKSTDIEAMRAFSSFIKDSGRDLSEWTRKVQDVERQFGVSAAQIMRDVMDRMQRTGETFEAAWANIVQRLRDPEAWRQATYDNWRAAELEFMAGQERMGELAGMTPEQMAAEFLAGGDVLGEGAGGMIDPAVQAIEDARQAMVAEIQGLLGDIAGLFRSDEEGQQAAEDYIDRISNPFRDDDQIERAMNNLFLNEIPQTIADGSTVTNEETLRFVAQQLATMNTLEPGAMEAGRGAMAGHWDGMAEQLGPLLSWLETEVVAELLETMTLAEALEEIGQEDLAAFVRGMEAQQYRAHLTALGIKDDVIDALEAAGEASGKGKSVAESYAAAIALQERISVLPAAWGIRNAAVEALFGNASAGGQSLINSWVNGMKIAWTYRIPDVFGIMSTARAIMGGSLPTEGPLKGGVASGGRSVLESWLTGMEHVAPRLLGFLNSLTGSAASMLSLQPAVGAGQFMPSMAHAGMLGTPLAMQAQSMAGPVQPAQNITHIHVNIEGEKPVVSTAQEILREASRLRRLSA